MHNCLEVYQAFVSHLKLKLPCNSIMLIKAIFVGPAKKGRKGSLNAITSCKPLEGVFVTKFVTENVTDALIPESSYKNEANETAQGRRQVSYWENTFELAGLVTILSNCLRRRLSLMLGHQISPKLHLSSK